MPDSRELAELGITEAFPTGITVVTDADTLVKHQDLLDKVRWLFQPMFGSGWMLTNFRRSLSL